MMIMILGWSCPLFSEEEAKMINMDWKPVNGALAYQVQIKTSGGSDPIIDERTDTSNIKVSVKPGTYQRRIAVVNKFNKISSWTQWSKFTVKGVAKPVINTVIPEGKENTQGLHRLVVNGKNFLRQSKIFIEFPGVAKQEIPFEYISSRQIAISLKTSRYEDGRYSISVLNPKGLEETKENSVVIKDKQLVVDKKAIERAQKDSVSETKNTDGAFAPTLIPGLPGFLRGDQSGLAWTGALGSFLVLSYLEYDAANITKDQLISDPLYLMFNDTALLFISSQGLSTDQLLFWSMVSNYRTELIQKKFERHQKNQLGWNAMAAGTLVAHFAWENRENMRWTHLVPGWTHYKNNNSARANAWIGTLGLTLAGMGYNNIQTKDLQTQSNEYIPNALISLNLLNNTSNLSDAQTQLFLVNSISEKNALDSRILSNKNLENNLSFALLALYLFQIVDATYVESGQSFTFNTRNATPENAFSHNSHRSPEQIHELEWSYSF